MKIGSIKKEHRIVTETKTATFSKNDLEKIILSHLMCRGYNIDGAKIFFDVEWNYVTDDWGMNRGIVTTFKRATVEFQGEEFSGEAELQTKE